MKILIRLITWTGLIYTDIKFLTQIPLVTLTETGADMSRFKNELTPPVAALIFHRKIIRSKVCSRATKQTSR